MLLEMFRRGLGCCASVVLETLSGMTETSSPGCAACRHHSKIIRHAVLGLDTQEGQLGLDSPDGEPKIADTSDDPNGARETVYTCQHPQQRGQTPPGTHVGPQAGAGCGLFAAGERRVVTSPRLLSALARFDSVRDDDEK